MPVYDLSIIREMLTATFNVGEINTLAFDLFPKLYSDFPGAMTTSERIIRIVDTAARNGRIPDLLAYVKQKNAYQYGRFADHLIKEDIMPPQTTYQQQRLQDLSRHIEQDSILLRQYEDQLRLETDPRRLLAIENEIKRQNEALTRYQQQYAALEQESGTTTPTTAAEGTPTEMAAIAQKLEGLSQQLDDVNEQVKRSEAAIRQDLSAGQEAILQRIDQQHQQTVSLLVKQLDRNQLELVELALDAAGQQQIAQWQADQLHLLVQQALLDLAHLRQGQPDAAQWQTVLNLVQQEMAWEQKLTLTLPLIPGILAFETETAVDVLPALKQSWQNLINRLQKRKGA